MTTLYRFKSILILIICSFLFAHKSSAETNPSTINSSGPFSLSNAVPGELLIKFKPQLTRGAMSTMVTRYKTRFNAQSKTRINLLNVEHWKLNENQDLQATLSQLQSDPNVLLAEPNYRRYRRSRVPRALSDFPQNRARLVDLNLKNLWDNVKETDFRKQNKVKVAVIDDAFNVNHPDLKANIIAPFDAIKNDVDPSPDNCIGGDGNPDPEAHGTGVVGVVGAVSGNNEGIDGAGDNASIVPIRISCQYTVSGEMRAYAYAIKENVDIISISWGGPQYSEMERLSIQNLREKNILVVTAAGNFDTDNDQVADYPSGLDLPNILSIAAMNDSKVLTPWSQYGQLTVDIAAPGDSITTLAGESGYQTKAGTSYSAPFVAGVAASLLARSPEGISVLDIKAAILASAVPFSDNLKERLVTDGYVDALAAYEALIDPEPVVIITKIEIDDSAIGGNGNGEVDPGESIILNVTVSNIGEKASILSALLVSPTLGRLSDAITVNNVPVFDQATFQYGSVVLKFPVDFSNFYALQNVSFELYITSTYGASNSKAEVTRYFSIIAGSLTLDTPVNNTIRKNDNDQDEFHYYHVNVDNTLDVLDIRLSVDKSPSAFDLLVKYDSSPQFTFDDFSKSLDFDVLTKQSKVSENQRIVSIKDPAPGTYYIVVIAKNSESDVDYQLLATSNNNSKKPTPQGCTLSDNNHNAIDPLFLILLLLSSWRIRSSDKKWLNTHAL